uniref:integrase core domain-containing protein n=1 Tax=Escherichia coli TaxID=562 RepID=UPI00207787A2
LAPASDTTQPSLVFFFFKQKAGYQISGCPVGSEVWIRDRSINGLYKAEVIHRKSWKNRAEVELATLTWVDWYNNRRLLERLGHTPPDDARKANFDYIGMVVLVA